MEAYIRVVTIFFGRKTSYAILTVGKSIAGIPSKEALKDTGYYRFLILWTDVNGLIRICSDGKEISYNSFRE